MRTIPLLIVLLALSACGQPDTPSSPPAVREASRNAAAAPQPMPRSSIEGWETDFTAYAAIGSALPDFSGKQSGGPDLTQEALRDRWTILGFGSFDTDTDAEIRFVTALNSAADQDPDLDLLQVYRADTNAAATRVRPWPSLADDGKIAALFGVSTTPAYLLIGPDLTIEGYRGALSKTPDDGIKSVIRGIAEIRKQVTAPQ